VVDVIVIGAGIVGAACARALAVSGRGVLVLDRGATAGGTTSRGEGNILVSDKEPGPELELARHALRMWPGLVDELADELGASFPSLEYDPKGGLVVATTAEGAQPLVDFARSQREAGIDAQVVPVERALELEPDLNPGVTASVYYPEDAQVEPVVAAEALLASARLHGAEVRQGVEVTGAIVNGSGAIVGVRTGAGDIPCGAVVVAAGPWSGDVAERLGVLLPVRPRRGMVLVTSRMPHRIFHKVYDADYVGAVASGDAVLQTSSVVESTAAGTVLIGSSREQIGFDDRLRVEVLEQLATKALRLFPFLRDQAVMRAYGGFRPYMPDHLPVISADHRMPGLWHATGHEGAGIGLSVATADLLTAAMSSSAPAIDASEFSLQRASLAPFLGEVA
jgi:glycine/D-amino acid oxidase-like deaminating enzyme